MHSFLRTSSLYLYSLKWSMLKAPRLVLPALFFLIGYFRSYASSGPLARPSPADPASTSARKPASGPLRLFIRRFAQSMLGFLINLFNPLFRLNRRNKRVQNRDPASGSPRPTNQASAGVHHQVSIPKRVAPPKMTLQHKV